MNSTTRGERPHIAVFGRRNVGKSSLINKLTNQKLALVSSEAGTTTDPVYKSMELLPVGPVVMIDTAGIDDRGELGELRVKKTKEVMRKADLAILTISIKKGIAKFEKDLINEFKKRNISFIAVINKSDLKNGKRELEDKIISFLEKEDIDYIKASAKKEIAIDEIRKLIARKIPEDYSKNTIIGDLIEEGDVVVLVTPIDSSAPKGRLILPQVQTIRNILDHNGTALVTKKEEVASEVAKLKDKPKIVVTDSQAFQTVSDSLGDDIMLTGFSVLFARYKGDLKTFVNGVKAMENLKAGDRVLIAEACTHRRQKDDIGTVKIPNWIHEKISSKIQFDHVSGREFPENLNEYDLILHCGSCMLNRKEVLTRLNEAKSKGIAVVNYGMAIAYLHGILDRALEPFSKAALLWEKAEEVI